MKKAGTGKIHISMLLSTVSMLLLSGCAVSQSSVDLSKKVGEEIEQGRVAHLSTLDAFYQSLKAGNDQWVISTYLPRLIEKTKADLKVGCAAAKDTTAACAQLGTDDVAMQVEGTVGYRDSLQRLLEDNRDDAFRIVNEHYAGLSAANAGVTGLLASAVGVKNATKDAASTLNRTTGVKIDFDAIQKTMDEFLAKAGGAGANVSELEKRLSDILGKPEKE